ncbi:unannotated protein [freshwater metagenome]|uniref:Unannotated protein n=1 Tax=freshwater metagenome TaxID=449393 RepID=A0A6J6IC58_9ZZZZ
MDVGLVERRQVIVVEAHPLAVLPVIGLELRGGLGILDDRIHPTAQLLHRLEITDFHGGKVLGRLGGSLRVRPHDVGPTVVDEIDGRLRSGDGLSEVDDSLFLPTRLEALEPCLVGRTVVADTDGAGGALEHEQILRRFRQLGHRLNRGCTCPDDPDALVAELVHEVARTAAGVVVVPARGVEHLALEGFDARDAGDLGLVEDATGNHDVLRTDRVAARGRDDPAAGTVVPYRSGDHGLEERTVVEIERATEQLAVLEDLGCARVALRRHVAGLLEEGKVGVRLDITHATRVAVPVPGATEVATLFHDAEIRDARLLEINSCEHAGEATTHDDDLGRLGDRLAGEGRIGVGIGVELRELVLQ